MVRKPLPWLKFTDAPPRRLVTPVTWYPASRTRTALPADGFVTTCTYCTLSLMVALPWLSSTLVIVQYPYAPLPRLPPGMPPYMNPPPSTRCTELQIWLMYPLKKLLKSAWLDGNFPLTCGASSISDFTELPALAMYRPMFSALFTPGFEPPYHHGPVS